MCLSAEGQSLKTSCYWGVGVTGIFADFAELRIVEPFQRIELNNLESKNGTRQIFFVPIQTRWWLPWQVARPTALTAPPCATGKMKEWQFLWLCGNKAPSHELWGGCARPSLLLLPPTVPVCGWIQSALTNARARPLYTHKHETLPNGPKSLATNPPSLSHRAPRWENS